MFRVGAMKDFRQMKQRGEKITALKASDYPTARLLDESGIDIILVGDSLGMVVLGYQDTTRVTLEEMLHHTRAAARGVKQARVMSPRLKQSQKPAFRLWRTSACCPKVCARKVAIESRAGHNRRPKR